MPSLPLERAGVRYYDLMNYEQPRREGWDLADVLLMQGP